MIKHARNSEIFRHSGSTVGKLKRLAAAVSAKIAELSRWDVLEVRPASAAVGSKAAFDILPSGRLRWVIAISGEPLIENPPMVVTHRKLFRIRAAESASHPHSMRT